MTNRALSRCQQLPAPIGMILGMILQRLSHNELENHHAIHGKTHYFDWAMFNRYVSHYQRVNHMILGVQLCSTDVAGAPLTSQMSIFASGTARHTGTIDYRYYRLSGFWEAVLNIPYDIKSFKVILKVASWCISIVDGEIHSTNWCFSLLFWIDTFGCCLRFDWELGGLSIPITYMILPSR